MSEKVSRRILTRTLNIAMKLEDRWVVLIVYKDQDGVRTRRHISPIRYLPSKVEALCLGREEPRHFILDNIESIELVHASEVLMPMPIETLEKNPSVEASCIES